MAGAFSQSEPTIALSLSLVSRGCMVHGSTAPMGGGWADADWPMEHSIAVLRGDAKATFGPILGGAAEQQGKTMHREL